MPAFPFCDGRRSTWADQACRRDPAGLEPTGVRVDVPFPPGHLEKFHGVRDEGRSSPGKEARVGGRRRLPGPDGQRGTANGARERDANEARTALFTVTASDQGG
jgi:hypothetical protein